MRFPLLFSLALAACGLATLPAAAQAPANDLCTGSQLLVSGIGIQGTTVGAADDLPGVVGCQTGGTSASYPEVWYAFVASATSMTYRFNCPYDSSAALGLHLFSGTCGSLQLEDSRCGAGNIIGVHNGLVLGDTYYVAVTAPDSSSFTNNFALTVTLVAPSVLPSQDCSGAVVLAQLDSIYQLLSPMGNGADPNEVSPSNSCWGGGGERQSKWYRFTAGNTGLLEFNINPVDPNDDYDWAVWDVTTEPDSCTAKGNAIACNWTGQRGATGLSACPTQEPGYQGGDQFDNTTTGQTGANAPITVQAGRVYALLVDNFTASTSGFNLKFGGACDTTGSGPRPAQLGLGATYTAVARPGLMINFTPVVTVSPTLPISYHWSFGDGNTSTQITPSHTYATAGTYYTTLVVTDLLGTTATYGRSLTASITGVAEEVARATRLALAPNPASGIVRLTLGAPTPSRTTVQLFNALGRLVRTAPMEARETTADLNLDGLRAGVYSVRVGGEVRRLVIAD